MKALTPHKGLKPFGLEQYLLLLFGVCCWWLVLISGNMGSDSIVLSYAPILLLSLMKWVALCICVFVSSKIHRVITRP